MRGTALDDADFRRRCPIGDLKIPPEVMPHMQRLLAGGYSDAMLWLGPTSSLTSSPSLPDAYLDDGYRKEILRHWSLYGMAGEESDLEVGKNPASPRPYAH